MEYPHSVRNEIGHASSVMIHFSASNLLIKFGEFALGESNARKCLKEKHFPTTQKQRLQVVESITELLASSNM